jgi:hypothetical protein
MGAVDYYDHAVLGLAVISSLFASAALILSLRKTSSLTATTILPVPVIAPPAVESKKSDDDDGSDDDSEDKEKEKEKEKGDIIDDAYKLIHQRYNRKDYKWDDFDPLKDAQTHKGVVFIVYHRHYEPSAVRPLERLVEVHSDSLKDVLRGCLKHVDTVLDPKPLV